MSIAQMRPTFSLETEMSAEDVMQCIRASVTEVPEKYQGQFTSHHAMISIGESKRRFWSPWLNLEVRDDQPRRQIFGQFSPHPSIWTGFMFSYLAIAVLMFFFVILGISQQIAQQSPWAYGFIPLGLLIAFLLWFASKAGQKLAQAEMAQLKSSIETCLSAGESVTPNGKEEG